MFDQLFTALFEYQFFINALIGVLLISAAAAMIGTYIVTRRLVAISGGVTHACFGGLGLGCFLGVNPMLTAGIFAVASALGVEWLSDRHKVREDSAIAVVWAVGMAVGVVFVFLTPGFVPELNSFLFGNILTMQIQSTHRLFNNFFQISVWQASIQYSASNASRSTILMVFLSVSISCSCCIFISSLDSDGLVVPR